MPITTRRSASKLAVPEEPRESRDKRMSEVIASLVSKHAKLLQLKQTLNDLNISAATETPAATPGSVSKQGRLTRRRIEMEKKRQCSAKLYSPVKNHKNHQIFEKPFGEDKEFRGICNKHITLTEIADNIEHDRYNTPTELKRDLLLVFQNATMFYGYDHPIHKAAVEFRNDIWPHLTENKMFASKD